MKDLKELRPYQVEDLSLYIKNPRFMNLSDPGTGKTPSVCVYQNYLWNRKGVKSAWAQPKSLLEKNKEEILEFTNFHQDEIIIVDGTPKQREKQHKDKNGKVFLMGFKRFSDDWMTLKEAHPELNALQVDEIHMGYKGHASARSQSMFKAMKQLDYFLPMTGTLIDGRLDSAYPCIHVIEPRYYVSHGSFMAQHAIYDFDGNIIGWKNHEKLGRILKTHSIRRLFDDVYGKQAVVVNHELVSMSQKQRNAYEELEEKAMLELEDKFLDASEPGVHTIRCRQVMACPEIFGIMKPTEKTGKDEQLLVHLENHRNTGKPLVIYAVLQPEIERIAKICKQEGFEVGVINGTVPLKERNRVDQAFRRGAIDIVVASPATAAVGYNWGHVDHIIFASLDYLPSNFEQAYKRAIRGKRDKALLVTILEYRKSIDQRLFARVNSKSKDAHLVDNTYSKLKLGNSNNGE